MTAAPAIDWVLLDHAAERPVAVGDVVSIDAGGLPIYRVVGVAGPVVWLDDERHARTDAVPLARFRWRGETH